MRQQNRQYQIVNSFASILLSFRDMTTRRTKDDAVDDRRRRVMHNVLVQTTAIVHKQFYKMMWSGSTLWNSSLVKLVQNLFMSV